MVTCWKASAYKDNPVIKDVFSRVNVSTDQSSKIVGRATLFVKVSASRRWAFRVYAYENENGHRGYSPTEFAKSCGDKSKRSWQDTICMVLEGNTVTIKEYLDRCAGEMVPLAPAELEVSPGFDVLSAAEGLRELDPSDDHKASGSPSAATPLGQPAAKRRKKPKVSEGAAESGPSSSSIPEKDAPALIGGFYEEFVTKTRDVLQKELEEAERACVEAAAAIVQAEKDRSAAEEARSAAEGAQAEAGKKKEELKQRIASLDVTLDEIKNNTPLCSATINAALYLDSKAA